MRINFEPEAVANLHLNLTESDRKTFKLLPVVEVQELIKHFGHHNFIIWCYKTGVYTLPTIELVDWLKSKITNPAKTIEIGSGNNLLFRHLGIKGIDSQTQVLFNDYYETLGQVKTKPPEDVERIDGWEAVQKYQPELVIGSWITQLWDGKAGYTYGVNEEALVKRCTYLLLGNMESHNKKLKSIFRYRHFTYKVPSYISRSKVPQKNRVWIWQPDQLFKKVKTKGFG